MMYRGKHHSQAICACATHLLDRVYVILKEDRPYELRDVDGMPIIQFFILTAVAFWTRSWWWGLAIINLAALGKVAWSVFEGGQGGADFFEEYFQAMVAQAQSSARFSTRSLRC
jgi:hypothetical protein